MKPINNYEGLYSVTEDGSVFSHKRNKFLASSSDGKGYRKINLSKNGSCKTIRIHKLVTNAFIPNPENKQCVNHINGIKDDNRVENLEWCTYSENIQHAFDTGLCKSDGENNNNSKLTIEKVKEIRKLLKQGMKRIELASLFGVTPRTIGSIHDRKTWRHV